MGLLFAGRRRPAAEHQGQARDQPEDQNDNGSDAQPLAELLLPLTALLPLPLVAFSRTLSLTLFTARQGSLTSCFPVRL